MNHKGTVTLETDRLILRRFTVSDFHQMYNNWASEDKVTEFLTWPTHASPEISKMVLESWVPQYEKLDYYHWGIELKETNELIGSLAVVEVIESTLAANIGYCIGSRFWGNGYVPEAGKAVVKYLFDACGFQRIAACHAKDNPKSGRVMQKIGMTFEGMHRMGGKCNKGIIDEVWYSMLKSEYTYK